MVTKCVASGTEQPCNTSWVSHTGTQPAAIDMETVSDPSSDSPKSRLSPVLRMAGYKSEILTIPSLGLVIATEAHTTQRTVNLLDYDLVEQPNGRDAQSHTLSLQLHEFTHPAL